MATDQYTSSQVQRLPDDYADPMRHQEYLWRRWGALKTERASWDSHARELASLLLPRASRFTTSETNQGGPKHNKIYDNTGLRAARILGAGMMSGLTSPARPWMRFKIADDDLMEYEPVKVWCAETSRLVLSALGKSNAYRVLHQGYIEQGVFGTSASIVMVAVTWPSVAACSTSSTASRSSTSWRVTRSAEASGRPCACSRCTSPRRVGASGRPGGSSDNSAA